MGALEDAAKLIREEIARLEQALGLMEGVSTNRRRPGRPRKVKKTRTLSPEARARIAAAQRRRWAKQRKAAKAGQAAAGA